MSDQQLPILYTFRRCPYAMRARMALCLAHINVICREIDLKNKHPVFVAISPKASVPVLVVNKQQILEESLDIIDYVCEKQPELQADLHDDLKNNCYHALLQQLHQSFIPAMHAIKYRTDLDDHVQQTYHSQLADFCQALEHQLQAHDYLFGTTLGKADITILPFIRQLSRVDESIYEKYQTPLCQNWLQRICDSAMFAVVMKKNPLWDVSQNPIMLLND